LPKRGLDRFRLARRPAAEEPDHWHRGLLRARRERLHARPFSATNAACPRRRGNRVTRRLPPPWRADKFSGGYVVRDANGFAVAYVYGRSTEAEAMEAKQMTMDEARRVASNIAKLPEMLRGE